MLWIPLIRHKNIYLSWSSNLILFLLTNNFMTKQYGIMVLPCVGSFVQTINHCIFLNIIIIINTIKVCGKFFYQNVTNICLGCHHQTLYSQISDFFYWTTVIIIIPWMICSCKLHVEKICTKRAVFKYYAGGNMQ